MSVKISELPVLDSLADNDVLAGVDTSANTTSKVTLGSLKQYIYTNTQYTAGTNIDITNNVVSAPNVYNKDEMDSQIEELQSEVDSLSMIYNAFPTESEEGESFTLDDTAEVKFKKLDLKGNTSQTSYSGKNLLGVSNGSKTSNGITLTITNNNILTYSGTATGTYARFDSENHTLPAGTYTFSIDKATTGNERVVLYYTLADNSVGTFQISTNNTSTTNTLSSSITQWYVGINNITSGTSYSGTFKLQLESGSTKTDYERYVGGSASPNPDFPQPVNVVSGDNTINVIGKNLFGGFEFSRSGAGVTFTTHKNGSITMSGTSTAATYSLGTSDISTYKKTLVAGTYTLSGGTSSINLVITNSSGTNLCNTNGANSVTFTLNSDTDIVVRANVPNETVTNTTVYPMLSTSGIDYQEYQGNTYNIDLPEGMELCKIGNDQDYFYKDNGSWYLHKEVRHTCLAVANMNNSDNYPGWQNVPNLHNDYPTQNTVFTALTSIKDNISLDGNGLLINTMGNGSTLFLSRAVFNLTQTQWVTNYPNLVFDFYYGLQTPTNTLIEDTTLISQLDALETAMSYKGQTNISQINNDLPFIINAEAILSLQNVLDRIELLES